MHTRRTMLAAAGVLAAPALRAQPAAVRVGLVQSTTGGSAALYGTEQKNAAELAVEDIARAGGPRLTLLHEDDGADRGQTVNIYQRLIARDRVAAILGPTLSTSAFAANPIAQRAGVPVIASSNTAAGVTAIGDFIFRVSPGEDAVFPGVLRRVAAARHIRRAAQIYGVDDQFTRSAFDVQRKALLDQGIEVVATETYQRGDVDFAAQLTKIRAARPDAIVLGTLAEETAAIIRQARALGIGPEVGLIGTSAAISSKLFELARDAAEGLVVGASWFAGYDNPRNRAFVERYRARYGRTPDVFAAQGYDATGILADAVARAGGEDGRRIRDALAATRGFEGVLGTIGFDANREPVIEPKVLVARGGSFVAFG